MTRRRLLPIVAALLAFAPLPAGAGRHKSHRNASDSSPVPQAAAIHGTVRAGTKTLSHIAVRLVHKNRSNRTTRGGQFTFHNLKPGVYTLVAHTRHHGSGRVSLAIAPGQTSDVVLVVRPPRPFFHRHGGVATPGHTPGHTAGL